MFLKTLRVQLKSVKPYILKYGMHLQNNEKNVLNNKHLVLHPQDNL
jgi:hypothetical protein